MRIIAGRFRGRQLVGFKARNIRPTTDRVKESIFNKIQPQLEGARVLDLFSGTGNLSLEALSRGAETVVAVESHPRSLEIIRQNLRHFQVENEVEIIKKDVLSFLKLWKGPAFDIILADPPFTKKMAHAVMEQLVCSQVIAPTSLIIIESSAQERIDDEYSPLKLLDRKKFGDKSVSYFTVTG